MSSPLIKTYAKSLFQNLRKSQSEKVSENSFAIEKITSSESKNFLPNIFIAAEELALIRATLISSPKMSAVFKNPTYPESQKLDILLSIFPGLTLTVKSFLKVLTERSHLSFLPEISEEFTGIILKFKNTTRVNIVTASQLEEKIGNILLKTLKKITNSKDIILTTAYNPKLLGGIIVEYNSVAIDASILKEFSLFFND
jgi:ATP synthase F1 delta subunit